MFVNKMLRANVNYTITILNILQLLFVVDLKSQLSFFLRIFALNRQY